MPDVAAAAFLGSETPNVEHAAKDKKPLNIFYVLAVLVAVLRYYIDGKGAICNLRGVDMRTQYI